MTIHGSTIKGNTADNAGGGIFNDATSTTTLTGSTISGNTAGGNGGGILNEGTADKLDIADSTIKGNTAGGSGDGIKGSFTDSGGNNFLDTNSP